MRRYKQVLLTIFITLAMIIMAWYAGKGRVREPMTLVVAARCDIPAGCQITADQLIQIQIPAKLKADCYLTEITEVAGQWTANSLQEGELVSTQRLARIAVGLAYPDPGPGRRLLTIKLEAADANGFWLAAGNRVDIYLIPHNRESNISIQVLENIRIMDIIGSESAAGGIAQPSAGEDALICLDLDMVQARLISGAQGLYDLRLAAVNEAADTGGDMAAG